LNFVKVSAGATRVQRIRQESLAILRVNGQYSPNKLFSTEQMYLGGVYSIRGYQPSEILGDYGVAGSLEFRVPFPFLKQILPEKYKHLSRKVQLVAFYDFGYVKDNDNLYAYAKKFFPSTGF
ncbi:MAG: ShlB/FhaC/HecB family hemolysin secretion/activation protein, partial [bacterium]|nr:ShlB/FhaC/HecB family hemolysin secretion/activation protein [bacterium]